MALLALLARSTGTPNPPADALASWRSRLASTDRMNAVLVAVGDSLTDMDATSIDSTGWTANLARQLIPHTPGAVSFYDVGHLPEWAPSWGPVGLHVVNVAISGRTSYSYITLHESMPQIVAAGPTVVMHMIGMNDYNFTGRTPVEVADEIVKRMGMVDTALSDAGKELPTHVVMVEPRDTSPRPEQPADWWDVYVAELARIVKADEERRVLANIDAAFGNDTGLRGSDDIHLTTAGYQRVADTMHELLTGTTV